MADEFTLRIQLPQPQELPNPEGANYFNFTVVGLLPGSVAFFVLNLPARIFGVDAAVGYRALGLAVIVLVYYLLWMLVRLSYRALAR